MDEDTLSSRCKPEVLLYWVLALVAEDVLCGLPERDCAGRSGGIKGGEFPSAGECDG